MLQSGPILEVNAALLNLHYSSFPKMLQHPSRGHTFRLNMVGSRSWVYLMRTMQPPLALPLTNSLVSARRGSPSGQGHSYGPHRTRSVQRLQAMGQQVHQA
jgi:hypothetical protein